MGDRAHGGSGDGYRDGVDKLSEPAPLRHIGIYGYHAGFLRRFPTLAQSPLETIESLPLMWGRVHIGIAIASAKPGKPAPLPMSTTGWAGVMVTSWTTGVNPMNVVRSE